MSLTITQPTRVYRTARAAQRGRGNAPTITPGTYTPCERRGDLARIPAGWINTKGATCPKPTSPPRSSTHASMNG